MVRVSQVPEGELEAGSRRMARRLTRSWPTWPPSRRGNLRRPRPRHPSSPSRVLGNSGQSPRIIARAWARPRPEPSPPIVAAGLAASAGVTARCRYRRRGAGRPRGARHCREPHPVDGPGGRITGSDTPVSSVRRIASASAGAADRASGNAPAAGGSAVERNGGAAGRRARVAVQGQARGRACVEGLGETLETIEEFARGSEDLSGRLHHEVLTSRMRPLADGIRGFPRLVRDVSRQLGKQAKFEVVGETTGVDRDILDGLEAPLNHLIRNALDHGLETPEERAAAGKNPAGTIRLEARHRAGMLQIMLGDDGRGIDLERLRAKVVEKGLTTAPMAGRLSEAELLDFLFLPGFSTKEQVTEISGRGVGLDVVQSMVQAVRGSVRVSSQPGKGTRFILQLPITVSVIRALLVEIAGEPFAFPLNRIDRILMLDRHDVRELEGKPHMLLDDQPVGLVEAAQVLELPAAPRENGRLPVVVASDRSHRFGVVVDRFLGERDLRVAPLDPRLGKVPNLNSSSVLENGWPVLIIDVEDLIRSIDNLSTGRRLKKLPPRRPRTRARGPKRVLVVDDSITVRELERQLLENRGYTVDVAVDGVDGWNAVRSGRYDLVVSDIDMPRMDGIQLVSHIKEDDRLRAFP